MFKHLPSKMVYKYSTNAGNLKVLSSLCEKRPNIFLNKTNLSRKMYVFSLSELLFKCVGCGRNEGFPKNSHSEMSSMMFYADGSKLLANQLRYVYPVVGNWIISPKQIRVKIQHIWNHHPQKCIKIPNIYQQTTTFTYRNMYRHVSGHKTPPKCVCNLFEDLQPQNPGV